MDRLINTFEAGIKTALLAQLPILLFSVVIGLTWGAPHVEPGIEAIGQWLWSCALTWGAPLALLGFVVGALPGGEGGRES